MRRAAFWLLGSIAALLTVAGLTAFAVAPWIHGSDSARLCGSAAVALFVAFVTVMALLILADE